MRRLLMLVVSMMAIAHGQLAAAQIYQYGVGYAQTSYLNYEQFDMNDPQIQADFLNSYNNRGGIISLGAGNSAPPANCMLNEAWAVGNLQPCANCLPPPNTLFVLGTYPVARLCWSQLSSAMIGTATAAPSGGLALWKSTNPLYCDTQCLLHGSCDQNGQCVCPLFNSSTSVGWKGSNCQIMVPPAGNTSYFAQLTWSNLFDSERFMFSVVGPCQVYVTRMPAVSQFGDYIPVQNVLFNPSQLAFDVAQFPSGTTQMTMSIYIMAPTSNSFCVIGPLAGGTRVATTLTLTFSGMLPITISPNILIPLS